MAEGSSNLNSLQNAQLQVIASDKHCEFVWETLIFSLNNHSKQPKPAFQDAHCPLFVSWYKLPTNGHSMDSKRLRGCIGTLEPQRLHLALRDYTISSAFRDARFPPISHNEVQNLICFVSLLTNFEKAKDYLDWEIGVHGIIIRFVDPNSRSKRERQATFLPEVMVDERLDKITAINMLIQKSGFEGSITEDLRRSIKLQRYQSTQYEMTYTEYVARKMRAGKNGYHINV